MKKNTTRKKQKERQISFTGICCCLFVFACVTGAVNSQNNTSKNPKVAQVHMLYADSFNMEKEISPDAYIARGNVVFLHDSTYMYCDSAYMYRNTNTLEAFSNVRIVQGDSLFIYGDYLTYLGNIRLAKMRQNVRMEHNDVTLFTDSFNYDRIKNIAYYFDGGMLVDSTNELTSVYGQYLPATKEATFRKDVQLLNEKMVLKSDTLKYWTETKEALILGESVIESDSGIIYSSLGWYDTQTDDSKLYNRSLVVSKDGQKNLTADTLFYNQQTGFGEAFGNMFLNDTTKKIILTGNYGWYNDLAGMAMATDSAQCIEYSQGDTLFLHADTLRMFTVEEENSRLVKAYYGVRFYRTDLQGVCDSLQYNTADSVLRLFTDPVLWNAGYQLLGDTIHIYFNDSTIDRVHVLNYAFSVEKVDTGSYNQLKGNDLKAYFLSGELSQIHVSGNAETIYYPMEKDSTYIGMNYTQSGFFKIYVQNRQLNRMVIWPQPQGNTTPIPDLTPEAKSLKGFVLLDYLRPKDRYDIFIKVGRKQEDIEVVPRKNDKFVY